MSGRFDWQRSDARSLALACGSFIRGASSRGDQDGEPDALANAGHDTRALQAWLGHKNIQHTVRYTELAPDRFKDFWW